jgi:hypothetical protein
MKPTSASLAKKQLVASGKNNKVKICLGDITNYGTRLKYAFSRSAI